MRRYEILHRKWRCQKIENERPRREGMPLLGKTEAASSLEYQNGLEINSLGYKRDLQYEQPSRSM